MNSEVLVTSRSVMPSDWVAAWPSTEVFRNIQASTVWMGRQEAEVSDQWVQPIACAILSDHQGKYCLIRRKKAETKKDLRGRLTLVVGGHLDDRTVASESIESLLVETLRRELDEEVGLAQASQVEPLAVVTDLGSLDASRHVAFVFRVEVSPDALRLGAPEEFSMRSKYNLSFVTVSELGELRREFDPWSGLIFDYVLAFEAQNEAIGQLQIPLPTVLRRG